jgi:hypothetical protein
MKSRFCAGLSAFAAVVGMFCVTFALSDESPSESTRPKDSQKAASDKSSERVPRVSVVAAREQAKLMHDIYEATLEVMHRHYFRAERSVLPARAMEDVFAEMSKQSTAQARWISINTKAMSIHHEPETDFEKQAAKAITAGKEEFELVEKGYYQRAGRIPLGGGCVGCHAQQFSTLSPTSSPKFAGLVIRIPVNDK